MAGAEAFFNTTRFSKIRLRVKLAGKFAAQPISPLAPTPVYVVHIYINITTCPLLETYFNYSHKFTNRQRAVISIGQ